VKPPKIQLWATSNLIPYDLNAKKHDGAQVAKIAKAIQLHGWDVPIVVDRHGVIIKGHGRRLAALDLGLEKVPVIVRDDLTPDQVKAARLADNRVAISDIDPELLRQALAEIEEDLSGIFDSKELEFLDADLGTINEGAFITDMDATLADQKADLEQRTEHAAQARVPLAKAFGFRDVTGEQQLSITNLMAKAQAHTGKKDADALLTYLQELQEVA
jgi:ParB-like chromosome segregation protein Spo0J